MTILEGEWDTMERTPGLAAGKSRVSGARPLPSALLIQGDDGVQGGVMAGNLGKIGI
jgi:hypothetical protein